MKPTRLDQVPLPGLASQDAHAAAPTGNSSVRAGEPNAISTARPAGRLASSLAAGSSALQPSPPRSRIADAPATESPADEVDLHAIWHSPSALQPASSRSPAFQRQLAMSYLQLVDSMHLAPPNVQAHLWTDRLSPFALHLPVLGPNGSDIEIPHSMLQAVRVTVHTKNDLLAMIDAIPDPAVRDTVRKLHSHPAGENIGLRADILRQIVTTFHQRQGTSGRALNAYADRDSLADMARSRDASVVGNGDTSPTTGLERAKVTLRALSHSLALPQRAPCVIPAGIQSEGFATDGRENDLVAAVPGADLPLSIVSEMLNTVQNLRYSGPLSDALNEQERQDPDLLSWTIGQLQASVACGVSSLASLHGGVMLPAQHEIDPRQALTSFLLAERVRGIEPQLQQRIHELEAQVRAAHDPAACKLHLREMSSLKAVYQEYICLINNFVNLGSYTPQVARTTLAASDGLNAFYKDVVGALPSIFGSEGSWQGSLKTSFAAVDAYVPTFDEQVQANRAILNLLTQQPAREV